MTNEYKTWIAEVKHKVRSSQVKAAIAVNSALIQFYWDLGKILSEKIKNSNWGDKILEQVSLDLKLEFPEMKGFSLTNLKYVKRFFEYFQFSPQLGDELKRLDFYSENPKLLTSSQSSKKSQITDSEIDIISPQVGDEIVYHYISQIPWGHIKIILTKIKDT